MNLLTFLHLSTSANPITPYLCRCAQRSAVLTISLSLSAALVSLSPSSLVIMKVSPSGCKGSHSGLSSPGLSWLVVTVKRYVRMCNT